MRILVLVAAILSMPAVAMACDADDFMKNVAILKNTDPPFRYYVDYPDYHRPEPKSDAAPQESLDLLRQVFEIAPPYFQQRLCRLTGLFIVPGAPWGYREHPSQFSPDEIPETFDKYIGMPGSSPPGYEGYETVMLEQMLRLMGVKWSAPRIGGVNKEADTTAMTVLAALAHEDGHVKFRETHTPTPGTPFDFNRFCDGSYFRGSWTEPVDVTPADKVPVKGTHLTPDVQMGEVFEAAKSSGAAAGNVLRKMFRSERWVTLIGAASPEHDWVETYKIAVLMRAKTPLRQMKLQIPGVQGIDLMKPIKRNTEIARKLACFNSLFGE